MLESPVAALLYGIAAMVVCAAIAGATYGVGAAIMVVVACVVSGVAVAYATFLQADSEAEEDNEDEE